MKVPIFVNFSPIRHLLLTDADPKMTHKKSLMNGDKEISYFTFPANFHPINHFLNVNQSLKGGLRRLGSRARK